MPDYPLVTVLIAAYNEASRIQGVLDAVHGQDYPHDRMEVLVIDGVSDDGTGKTARDLLETADYFRAEVLTNALRSRPTSLNMGLEAARGSIICRIDARSRPSPNHVARCVELLADSTNAVVGGGQRPRLEGDHGLEARGVARALGNRWSMGLSKYRRGGSSGPAETVYLGAFRTEDLRAEGGWDDRLKVNQDWDLNQRLRIRGTVWFDDSLTVDYLPRTTIRGIWAQYTTFGAGKVAYWSATGTRPNGRQWVGLLGPVALAIGGVAFVAASHRRRRHAALTVGTAVIVLGAIDHLGASDEQSPPIQVRAISMTAITAVVIGWAWGAAKAMGNLWRNSPEH